MERERRHQPRAGKGREAADTEQRRRLRNKKEEADKTLGERDFWHHFTGKKLSSEVKKLD